MRLCHQVTNLHTFIIIVVSRNVSWKIVKVQTFISPLFFLRFSSLFHCPCCSLLLFALELQLETGVDFSFKCHLWWHYQYWFFLRCPGRLFAAGMQQECRNSGLLKTGRHWSHCANIIIIIDNFYMRFFPWGPKRLQRIITPVIGYISMLYLQCTISTPQGAFLAWYSSLKWRWQIQAQ